MPIEKTVSYKVKFDFTDADRQADAAAKRQNARQRIAQNRVPGTTRPAAGEMGSSTQNVTHFLRQIIGSESRLGRIINAGTTLFGGGRGSLGGGRIIGGGGGGIITRLFSGFGGMGGGGGGGMAAAAAGGEGAGMGLAGAGLAAAGPIGLAVAGAAIVVTTALKSVAEQLRGFAEGVAKISKGLVTGNSSSALHGIVDIGQSMIGGKSGLLTNFILRGPVGVVVGYLIGNVLGGIVHKLIDGLDGLVQALGKFSPIINAQLAVFQVKQFMFSYQMAQVFQPLMSAWIKLKSFILDVLGAFGQVIRPLVQMAGNALSNFVDYLRYATIGILEYLSTFLQEISPMIAALAPDMMDALNGVVNGLNKTVGILTRTNDSLETAAQKLARSFVDSILKYKNVVNPKAWISTNQHLLNHPFGNMKQELLPGQDAFIARNYPLANLSPVMPQNQANQNEMNNFQEIHEREHPNLRHGYQHPVTPATATPPAAATPPYVPGPTLQWQNSISNQFNLKVSMDEMVEKSIAEIRRELSHCHEESAAETTLASLLVTGAVKGLLV